MFANMSAAMLPLAYTRLPDKRRAPPQIHIKELQRGGMMGAGGRKIIVRQAASLMNERSPQPALGTLNWLLS